MEIYSIDVLRICSKGEEGELEVGRGGQVRTFGGEGGDRRGKRALAT